MHLSPTTTTVPSTTVPGTTTTLPVVTVPTTAPPTTTAGPSLEEKQQAAGNRVAQASQQCHPFPAPIQGSTGADTSFGDVNDLAQVASGHGTLLD
ncbi:MAG TPA: hypothetical protein VGN51_18965 [Acidimicrobiia bacterium]